MARQRQQPPAQPNPADMPDAQQLQAERDAKIQAHQDERTAQIEVLLATGRIQALGFMRKVVTVSELRMLQDLFEGNKFNGLPLPDSLKTELGRDTCVAKEDFCRAYLGCSLRTIEREMQYLQTVGEDSFELAKEMKLGHRDIAKLAKLPAAERGQVLESEAFASGDLKGIRELVETLILANAAERDTLQANHKRELSKKEDALALVQCQSDNNYQRWQEEKGIRERMSASKEERINQLEHELAAQNKTLPAAELEELYTSKIHAVEKGLVSQLVNLQLLAKEVSELENCPVSLPYRLAELLNSSVLKLVGIREDYQLDLPEDAVSNVQTTDWADGIYRDENGNLVIPDDLPVQ